LELPIVDTDQSLFTAATKVTVNNGKKARFWTASWIYGTLPVYFSQISTATGKERTELYWKQ
jgi:hypothetical protein